MTTGPLAPRPALPATTDGRRARGVQSRRAALESAVQLASRHGLEVLTIGALAAELGGSKSSTFALFGSKEELQLATLDTARTLLIDLVVRPALGAPEGLDRLLAIGDAWCDYLASDTFSGGCPLFAASAEMDGRPGAVRDAVRAVLGEWIALLEQNIRTAGTAAGRPDVDADGLAFGLNALGMAANWRRQLFDDGRGIELARASWRAQVQELTR
jgi:AcrR family transcriptional regulator